MLQAQATAPSNDAEEVKDAPPRPELVRDGGDSGRDGAQDLPLSVSPPLSLASPSGRAQAWSRSGIALSVYEDIDEIADEWKRFEQTAERTAFQSFGWLASWQHHIGAPRGTIPAIVIGRENDGNILFILQLAIASHGLIRRLTWLGSALCDYNAPLLAPQFSDRVSAERFRLAWRDILSLLRASVCWRFDLIDLEKMPDAIGEQRNPFLDLNVRPHPSGAYLANLGPDWEAFYARKRSAATRKRERRQLRQFADHGELRFVDAAPGEDAVRTLTALIAQKSQAFACMGVDDFFSRPGRREFFLALVSDPAMANLIHVSRLDLGSEMLAASVGLKHRDCYYLILSSYADGPLARLGPGRAHLNELIRYAIGAGFGRFDFTVGDEPYKRDWSDTELNLHDCLAGVSVRGCLMVGFTMLFRRTKRFIKQTPRLWQAFSKGRALLR